MNRPTDETLLAFLEGTLDENERLRVLDALDADAELAAELRRAAAGLEVVGLLGRAGGGGKEPYPGGTREPLPGERSEPLPGESSEPLPGESSGPSRGRISPWWAVAASAATLLIAVPATLRVAEAGPGEAAGADPAADAGQEPRGDGGRDAAHDPPGTSAASVADRELGVPEAAAPAYVLVLRGRWPDAGAVGVDEARGRATEYWGWTTELARDGRLLAAGDLRWEPGQRLGPSGRDVAVEAAELEGEDFLVGMIVLRADSYEEAVAIARECPHLRYGGSVSVRRVGSGFVTMPGMGDWST